MNKLDRVIFDIIKGGTQEFNNIKNITYLSITIYKCKCNLPEVRKRVFSLTQAGYLKITENTPGGIHISLTEKGKNLKWWELFFFRSP
jgi:predicted transcriptional regulator